MKFGVKYSIYRHKIGNGATGSYYNRTKISFILEDGRISAGSTSTSILAIVYFLIHRFYRVLAITYTWNYQWLVRSSNKTANLRTWIINCGLDIMCETPKR